MEEKKVRKQMPDGSAYDDSKRVELTEEQMEMIQGGVWDYANTRIVDGWDEAFASGVQVVWRENGVLDHIATVLAYTEVNGTATYFDLDCYLEGFYAYDVPANEVLLNFVQ